MEVHREVKALVLGVGNVLMGDEGVGVHAVKYLEHEKIPPSVTLLDGGTGGFHLLSVFQEYDPIIVIDATMDERPPGAVTVTRPKFASDFPRTLSAHDIGLRDLLESATLLGPLPELFLVAISIKSVQSMRMGLTAEVERSMGEVADRVRFILEELSLAAGGG